MLATYTVFANKRVRYVSISSADEPSALHHHRNEGRPLDDGKAAKKKVHIATRCAGAKDIFVKKTATSRDEDIANLIANAAHASWLS